MLSPKNRSKFIEENAMINKLKYLFLLVLCVGMIGGTMNISAQSNDSVLVSAKGKTLKKSDVEKLIQFYEWAFQAEFNSTQKADFQEFTEKEFRNDPIGSRKTIDDIVTTLPKILAADEDVQKETRSKFLEVFLPEARKGTDVNSQMLVSIYEAANGALPVEKQNSNDSYETVKTVQLGKYSAIVGKWVSGSSGSMVKTTSGVYLGGNASRFTYQFNADGTVEYTGIMNTMTGGCRMQIFRTGKGKATLNGDTLTINWGPSSFSRDDSCSPSKNYKKTLPAETEVYKANFETYFDDKQLCLSKDGKTCFSRDN